LRRVRAQMRDGGTIAIVSQPRCPGATSEHTDRAEQQIRLQLHEAGFKDARSARLALDPPAVCVLAISGDGSSAPAEPPVGES
jgi:hypothetical protein